MMAGFDNGGRRGTLPLELLAHTVVDTVRESLLVLDSGYVVRLANASFLRTFGVSASETEGRVVFDLGNGQWDIPALREFLRQVATEGTSFEDFEVNHTFAEIGPRTMLLNGRFLEVDGEDHLVLLAIEDVTSRRMLEESLARTMDELKRSNADLDQFASAASHDLQEPLRKILAFGERLRSRCASALDSEGMTYLDRVTGAASRMQRLIDELLLYSRLAVRPAPMTRVDLNEIARDVLDTIELRIREAGGRIEVGPLSTVSGNATQLRLLFQNVLANGLKYRQPGRAPVLRIHEQPGDRSVCLLFEDNGIGIEARHFARIFEPFQRLHSRDQYEGTGLGLAICGRVAARHGGTLTVESTVGAGSRFMVTLPRHQEKH